LERWDDAGVTAGMKAEGALRGAVPSPIGFEENDNMRTVIFAVLILYITAAMPVCAAEDIADPKVGLPQALQLCQKWFGEHRMLARHFIIVSAVLKPDVETPAFWEIRFRHRRTIPGRKQKRLMILTVKMDSTVERTQKE
jgi:hypothetical protein